MSMAATHLPVLVDAVDATVPGWSQVHDGDAEWTDPTCLRKLAAPILVSWAESL